MVSWSVEGGLVVGVDLGCGEGIHVRIRRCQALCSQELHLELSKYCSVPAVQSAGGPGVAETGFSDPPRSSQTRRENRQYRNGFLNMVILSTQASLSLSAG